MTRQRNHAARSSVTGRCTAYGAVRVNRPKALVNPTPSEGYIAATVSQIFASLDVEGLEIEQTTRCSDGYTAVGCTNVARNTQATAGVIETEIAVVVLTLDVE